MKIIIAPDSFKGTLSSLEVCNIISGVLKRKYPGAQIISIPVADGGEGTCEAYYHIFGGEKITVRAKSPLMKDVCACYAMLKNNTAVIETAAASGLFTDEEKDPLRASSFGTGELFLDAVKRGAQKILLGLGGSATTDGGTGFLSALGAKFLDKNGNALHPGGGELASLERIDLSGLDEAAKNIPVTVMCDVQNPLYGKKGAAYIFAPQKGADENQVKILDGCLQSLARVTEKTVGRDFSSLPGAGAAGGMGFCLSAFLNSRLQDGISLILSEADFERQAKNASLIITGEGKMDYQSFFGKVPFGVAKKSGGARVTAVVGVFEGDRKEAEENGICEIIETNPEHLPFEEIRGNAAEALKAAAEKIAVL